MATRACDLDVRFMIDVTNVSRRFGTVSNVKSGAFEPASPSRFKGRIHFVATMDKASLRQDFPSLY